MITSDSDMKYVNVRRLLIFIENSIDRGLQWVVLSPMQSLSGHACDVRFRIS